MVRMGIFYDLRITNDAFAQGDNRLVNRKPITSSRCVWLQQLPPVRSVRAGRTFNSSVAQKAVGSIRSYSVPTPPIRRYSPYAVRQRCGDDEAGRQAAMDLSGVLPEQDILDNTIASTVTYAAGRL